MKKYLSDILYVVAGLFIAFAFKGGVFSFLIFFAGISILLAWLNKSKTPDEFLTESSNEMDLKLGTTKVGRLFKKDPPTGAHPQLKDTVPASASHLNESSSRVKTEKIWSQADTELSQSLLGLLKGVKNLTPNAHTAAVFFLQNQIETCFVLKSFFSDSTEVVPNSKISKAGSLIGRLIENPNSHILEGDLYNFKGLYYKNGDTPIKSLLAVPIFNKEYGLYGALVLDSLTENAFTHKNLDAFVELAAVLYQLVQKSFVSAKNYIEKHQYSILYHYQRSFFKNMRVQSIYQEVFDYIKDNIPYDRLMILALEDAENKRCRVVKSDGFNAELLEGYEFSLSDKGLLVLALSKNRIIERHIKQDPTEYIYRINEAEPQNFDLQYLFAIPIVTDEKLGHANLAICLESVDVTPYTDHEKNLLRTFAGVAGFAYERAQAFETEQEKANKDGLTGLINHRAMQEKLRAEKLRAKRQKNDIGILMMDIDHFKKVNDTYGHPAGDKVIAGIASVLKKEVRSEIDLVARYGGEEFVVALIETSAKGLGETAERIRVAIESKEFEIGLNSPLKVSVSIGAYLLKFDDLDYASALKKADQALYKAKKLGRNQVFIYKKETPDSKEATNGMPSNQANTNQDTHNSPAITKNTKIPTQKEIAIQEFRETLRSPSIHPSQNHTDLSLKDESSLDDTRKGF